MAEITFEESVRQIDALTRRATASQAAGRWQDAVEQWRAVLAHPCARHQVADYEVLDEVHQVLRQAGQYDDAIAAKREAIAAGYRSVPDPETDIAECLLAAGRRDAADRLFAELRERDPDDVWLYNAAACSYGDVDGRVALRWSLEGIDVALATGDPDQVVMQLLECAEASWAALGEPVDRELVDRVERFCDEWTPPSSRRPWGDGPPLRDDPCSHCGYEPVTTRAQQDEMARRSRRRLLEQEQPEVLARLDDAFGGPERSARLPAPVELAVGWFPGGEWTEAIKRWPDLLEDLPTGHREYSRAIEARVKRIARHVGGRRMHISPLTVVGLEDHASGQGEHPGSAQARSGYAAEVLRTGDAMSWPPGRNDPCWCGSGRKYKKCCGPVPGLPDEE